MPQAHRQSRGFCHVREAAKRRSAKGRCGQTGPGAPVYGLLRHCAANVPARELAGALRRECAATPAAWAVGRPAPDFCAGSTGVDASSDRPPASLGNLGVGLGVGVGGCV